MSAATDKPICVMTVGYIQLLLPMDKAMKVVALLQGAVACEHSFERRGNDFRIQEGDLRLSMEMVQPSQVLMPDGAQMTPGTAPGRRAAPKAGNAPLRIEGRQR